VHKLKFYLEAFQISIRLRFHLLMVIKCKNAVLISPKLIRNIKTWSSSSCLARVRRLSMSFWMPAILARSFFFCLNTFPKINLLCSYPQKRFAALSTKPRCWKPGPSLLDFHIWFCFCGGVESDHNSRCTEISQSNYN